MKDKDQIQLTKEQEESIIKLFNDTIDNQKALNASAMMTVELYEGYIKFQDNYIESITKILGMTELEDHLEDALAKLEKVRDKSLDLLSSKLDEQEDNFREITNRFRQINLDNLDLQESVHGLPDIDLDKLMGKDNA